MSPHLERAYLLYEQRRYELAEKEIGQALTVNPNDARSLALLALCLLEQEKFTEATQRAQEAVGNAPTNRSLTIHLPESGTSATTSTRPNGRLKRRWPSTRTCRATTSRRG